MQQCAAQLHRLNMMEKRACTFANTLQKIIVGPSMGPSPSITGIGRIGSQFSPFGTQSQPALALLSGVGVASFPLPLSHTFLFNQKTLSYSEIVAQTLQLSTKISRFTRTWPMKPTSIILQWLSTSNPLPKLHPYSLLFLKQCGVQQPIPPIWKARQTPVSTIHYITVSRPIRYMAVPAICRHGCDIQNRDRCIYMLNNIIEHR